MRTLRTVRHASCALVALLLAAALAACGGGGGGSDSAAGNAQGAPGGGSGDSRNRASTLGRAPLPAARSVVYTAQLRVRADNVDQAAGKAKQMALAAGGHVQKESSATGDVTVLTFKIPSDRYATVLADLSGKLGTKLSLSQEAQDVTGEVADVNSRVKSAQASIASFRKLLGRAGSVGEIMSVEEQISQRQADLEALQARQKALQESVQYATVTVTLTAPSKAAPSGEDKAVGFAGGLEQGWNAFTATLAVISTIVGWLLPFLALATVIGVPVALLWRRIRPRRPLPPK